MPPRAEFYGPGPATAPLAPRRSSGGGRHPLAPALGRSLLGTPRERKRLPLDWKNLQRRLFACPCSASSPWRLQCAKSTLRVLAAAPRGSSWKLSEHDPPPQTGASSGPGARGRAGAARSGGFSCQGPPAAAPEPCRARSDRWDEERWAHKVLYRCPGCGRSPFVLGHPGASTLGPSSNRASRDLSLCRGSRTQLLAGKPHPWGWRWGGNDENPLSFGGPQAGPRVNPVRPLRAGAQVQRLEGSACGPRPPPRPDPPREPPAPPCAAPPRPSQVQYGSTAAERSV